MLSLFNWTGKSVRDIDVYCAVQPKRKFENRGERAGKAYTEVLESEDECGSK